MRDAVERFWSKVKVGEPHECWLWIAGTSDTGYGSFRLNNKTMNAHTFAYRETVAPVKGELDHLCRNKRCVNPAHLEDVTHRENVMRGASPLAQRARQTHCLRGHAFTAANTRVHSNGTRQCRECEFQRKRALNTKTMDDARSS